MPYSIKTVTLFSTPLRGVKNKKTGNVFGIVALHLVPRHLSPSGGTELSTPKGALVS